MVRKTDQKVVREHAHGGAGQIEVYEILAPGELRGRVSVYAKVVLPPGAAIGLHPHRGETESYYVLSGSGVFVEDGGRRTAVESGDICDISEGACHGMENTGGTPMELIALVVPA